MSTRSMRRKENFTRFSRAFSAVAGVVAAMAAVISLLQFLGISNLQDLWTSLLAPLWQHGTISAYAKAIGLVVLALILIVFAPQVLSRKIRRSPRWLPLSLLRFLVQTGITLLGLVVVALGLYLGYWLGLFPRTAATDAFAVSSGAVVLKVAIAAAILFAKGLVGGAGTAAGGYAVTQVIKSHSGEPDRPREHAPDGG